MKSAVDACLKGGGKTWGKVGKCIADGKMTGERGSVSELSHLYIILYNIMLIYIYISITNTIFSGFPIPPNNPLEIHKKTRFWTETL